MQIYFNAILIETDQNNKETTQSIKLFTSESDAETFVYSLFSYYSVLTKLSIQNSDNWRKVREADRNRRKTTAIERSEFTDIAIAHEKEFEQAVQKFSQDFYYVNMDDIDGNNFPVVTIRKEYRMG